MPTIQDTIIQAVKAKGYRILEDKDALCVILEDLSPGLQSERGFIDKVYNNRVGKILLNAYLSDPSGKEEYLREADEYLDRENGRNETWRKRLLSYFEPAIKGGLPGQEAMRKGQRVALDSSVKMALVGMGWDIGRYDGGHDFSLDVSAFMLGENGRCQRSEDFIFYNNLQGRNRAVAYLKDDLRGEDTRDNQVMIIDFSRIPDDVHRIAVCVSIYDAAARCQNFGQVTNAYIRVAKIANRLDMKGREQLRFHLGEWFSDETALVFGEIYRYRDEWKFNAVGAGFQGGMEALLNRFGLETA